MFENLSKRLTSVLDRLKNRGALSEADVVDSLREVRVALLEADVALPAVKDFITRVKEAAVGQDVLQSLTPGHMVVKIVYDHLVELLGREATPLNLAATPPVSILMVGLQGSGKTTTSAKLARFLKEKLHKKPLLVSLDVYRPAAQKQLEVLATQLSLPSLPIVEEEKPLAIAKRGLEVAKKQGCDVIIFDTAGRLHIDDTLMEEVQSLQNLIQPTETFLVADAMTGQDAVTMAKAFHETVVLSGLILTRLDGDARGGAALSMRYVTNCPIKFMGVGEKTDQLEIFDPRRIADRILDRGDIVALVEKAAEALDKNEAEAMAKKMQKGQFDLNDLSKQLQQMMKMGGMSSLLSMLPGIGKIKDKMNEAGLDNRLLKRQIAMISSMTRQERREPKLLNASRKRRIAKGSGVEVMEINKLLKQFDQMALMMKRMKKMGGAKGFLRGGFSPFGG